MSSVAELFAYDASSPLQLEVIAVERRAGVDVHPPARADGLAFFEELLAA
jgi:hypothetical protein